MFDIINTPHDWLNMFTIKKQEAGCTWHSLLEMDKQARLKQRRERAQIRKEQDRKDRVIVEYFKVKHPVQYEEALKYYTLLNNQYSNINDLRKTSGFKHFKATTRTTDSLVLEIPLAKMPKEAKENNTLPEAKETNVEKIDAIFPDIDMNDLVSEIPPQLVDSIIQDLRADPNLTALMDDVEDLVDSDIDVDIEIPEDMLEKELQQW